MQLLPMDRLGPREVSAGKVQFGIFLPWVSAADGNALSVRIIHETDQFLQDVVPLDFALTHSVDATYGDYWSGEVDLDRLGTYVYRYVLTSPLLAEPLDWIVDPFAREFGIGKLSAFTMGFANHIWSAGETVWKTPKLEKLIVYELMLHEFRGDLDHATERLAYLADLGVNCVEVMPITNVEATLNWGFEPIGFFGVDERFGDRRNFQRFVDRAHSLGIAVILDVVYGHTGTHFPYEYVYSRLGYRENPFMGSFAKNDFGPSTDWNRRFVQDYFFTVSHFWMTKCHVDGFRYDCVPNYWDGPEGVGYSKLVYETYQFVKGTSTDAEWQRFFEAGDINLIQCAEQLEDPKGVVWNSYTNATWQNATLGAAWSVARGERGVLYELGMALGLDGYPAEVSNEGDRLPKSAFQYLENHDHSRFLTAFGTEGNEPLFQRADRTKWYRVQPFLIALLLGKGIPLLWQGQELGADNVIAGDGFSRIGVIRPMPWELFYDEAGRGILGLVRKLTRLRKAHDEFTGGDYFFHNDWEQYQSKGVLVFSRANAGGFSLVALNFGGGDVEVPFRFERGGAYAELLHGNDNFSVTPGGERVVKVPGNYGRVWRT